MHSVQVAIAMLLHIRAVAQRIRSALQEKYVANARSQELALFQHVGNPSVCSVPTRYAAWTVLLDTHFVAQKPSMDKEATWICMDVQESTLDHVIPMQQMIIAVDVQVGLHLESVKTKIKNGS
jgi:hypothetical protein